MKGQIISTDFIAAVFLFITIFALFMTVWYSNVNYFQQVAEMQNMEKIASRALDIMVKSGGYPDNWESSPASASTIGLADSDRKLNANKLSAFIAMNYATAKDKLKTEGYEFYFAMQNSSIYKGMQPSSENFVLDRRIVIYNGIIQTIEISLWRQI